MAEPEIPEVSVDQLHEKIIAGQPGFICDVRTEGEYQDEHIEPTAARIDFDLIPMFLHKLPQDPAAEIYLLCRSGRRSGVVTLYLRSIGYSNAFNVAGGIVAWKAAGYDIVRAGE